MQRKIKRKLRGDVPVGQILLVVLGVAVVAALALVVFPMLGAVRAPSITLDSYNTKALGSYIVFAVKTGATIQYQGAFLLDSAGSQLASCSAHRSLQEAMNNANPIRSGTGIPAGSPFYVRCGYAPSPGKYYLRITYRAGNTDDSVLLEWIYS